VRSGAHADRRDLELQRFHWRKLQQKRIGKAGILRRLFGV
jgi:hypothetical protein